MTRRFHSQVPRGRLWTGLAAVLLLTLVVVAFLALYCLNTLGADDGVLVESEPAGASVLLNGRLAGATPLTLTGLPFGTYGMRLEKAGCIPVDLRVEVSAEKKPHIHQALPPVALGALNIKIKPDGAEVLVDGELMGHAPLRLDNVPAGPHELLVRKTNYSSYSQRFEITANKESRFEGIDLADKILELLESKVKTEPQRIGHYIDLAHYYFVNDRMDEAVEMFVRAEDLTRVPLNFDGAGFAGKDKMSPDEITLEMRLRREDESRLTKELDKHRAFANKDTRAFRMKLREAEDNSRKTNLKSWPLAEHAAQEFIASRSYERAAQVYLDFIDSGTPAKSPDLPRAYIGLLETRCIQSDADKASLIFEQFFALFQKDGPMLRACGSVLYPRCAELKDAAARNRFLGMAEKALKAGIELPGDASSKAQAQFELGMTLCLEERFNAAVPVLQQAVDGTHIANLQEDRLLRLAEALRKAGDKNGAIAIYEKLSKSDRDNVRESAHYGLNAAQQSDPKP